VIVDGVSRGVTPVALELNAGMHEVIFRAGSSERQIALQVDGGTRVAENVDLPVEAAGGVLEINSDPAGARVAIDGTAAGATPLTLRGIAPARHTVSVTQGATVVTRSVEVMAGATASVFVSLSSQTTAPTGMLAVESPLELRILERGQPLGLSNGAPIALTSGRHELDLVNETLEVRVSRAATVEAGKSTKITVALPNGTLSVNAAPWAEVFVDGRSVGVTPLGSISLPIGSHEIVWRHPQLGEKHQTVVVGAQTPARVTTDLNR
jgi:serine/threonine-protein kinase